MVRCGIIPGVKTLLADIDSSMLRHCVARIGGRQQLALATSKAQAMELLRHGADFEVVIACDRLEDGSGLALLDDIHTRWPHLTRVFCIAPHRLAMVRSRLSAFRLRHTLTYPLIPAKLELLLMQLSHAKRAATARPRPPAR
jgi:DNA-binding NtrC family response regulator